MSGHPISVRSVVTKNDLRTFITLPWKLYRSDPNWIPPLISEMRSTLTGPDNPQFAAGPHVLALAYRLPADGGGRGGAGIGGRGGAGAGRPRVVGRVVAGINERVNRAKDRKTGYVSLFESGSDYDVARALFDWACGWLREKGMTAVQGPVSPTNGDDYRGLLVKGFDSPPVLMDTYNPSFYVDFFERYGFVKDIDLFAYLYRPDSLSGRYDKVAAYAMSRYGYRTDPLSIKHLDRDLRDLKEVLDKAMPEEWADMVPPTYEELEGIGRTLRPLAEPEICCLARTGAGEPIGFIIGLPNYNEVLARLNGRLWPFGFAKFLWYRRRIKSARFFVAFVVPDWRKKGVTGAMFVHVLRAGRRLGYEWAEGSTIGETNYPMRRDAERAGGEHYKTYRIYRKDL